MMSTRAESSPPAAPAAIRQPSLAAPAVDEDGFPLVPWRAPTPTKSGPDSPTGEYAAPPRWPAAPASPGTSPPLLPHISPQALGLLVGETCATLPPDANARLCVAVRELTYNQRSVSVALAEALVEAARGDRTLSVADITRLQADLDPYAGALVVGLLAPLGAAGVQTRGRAVGETTAAVAPAARHLAAGGKAASERIGTGARHRRAAESASSGRRGRARASRLAGLAIRVAAARVATPRLAASLDRVDALLAATGALKNSPVRALDPIDRQLAGRTPVDEKFVLDHSTWGGSWLIRHARRHAAGGRPARAAVGYGVGYPLAAVAVAAGLCSLGTMTLPAVLAAAAWREDGRVPRRSEAGVREDAILRAVEALDRALRGLCGAELAALVVGGILVASDVTALAEAAREAACEVQRILATSANARVASHGYLALRLRGLANNHSLEDAHREATAITPLVDDSSGRV